ncbi:MAG: nuclear transport factor 2 family protein, partial [Spongiibacter sp.]
MSLSLQEISDRFEIQDLLYRYADIIDRRAVGELSGVFTTDAHIDYSAFGGSVGDVGETMAFLREALPAFSNTQHLNANI